MNSIGNHDAAACFTEDGQLVSFAEEERFTRNKHELGEVPIHAVRFCLQEAGVTLEQVDYCATPWMEGESELSALKRADPEVTFSVRFRQPGNTRLVSLVTSANWFEPVTTCAVDPAVYRGRLSNSQAYGDEPCAS